MSERSVETGLPVFSSSARVTAIVSGLLVLAVGGVAVFQTDNELGSAALVTAGVVIAGLAMFGNRIEAVEAAGVRFELERRARSARQQAQLAREAGETERAEEFERRAESLLAAASVVGSRYEHLRASEPSSWERTSKMEDVLREVRALDTSALTSADVARIFETGTDGNRVAALALIEGDPGLATADVLVDPIVNSRSAFEQYHALVAADRATGHLTPEHRSRVRAAVESQLAGPLGERSSDRRTVARRILEKLTPDPR